ncbi:MAG: YidC/Oxa1 family insertase periplasmic-domain containing protein, partial [Planctomycetota bacterium]|nr:YidC/Oxa1 family insertase periplasmic-domain containing protein [Planctomycetota bacterium]
KVEALYPSRTQVVEFGKYITKFTSRGGGIESLKLKMEDGEQVPLLDPMELDRPHFGLSVPGLRVDLATVDWNIIYDEASPQKISLEYPVENKWRVTKVFTFDSEKHLIRFLLQFKSIDGKQHEVESILYPFNGIVHDSEFRNAEYCQGMVGIEKGGWSVDLFTSSQVILPEHAPTVINNGDRGWIGLKNRYFTTVCIPESNREIEMTRSFNLNSLSTDAFYRQEKRVNVVTEIPFKSMFVGDKARTFQFTSYIGPIEESILAEAGRGLDEIYDPSGFNIVAGVIIAILSFFHSLVGNYGVAILLTTIVIRICIFPLTKKSQVSMHRMSKLQPKIKILRERYKDDQQKMGVEQMKLFRENNVNPMSGCLPILLQFPIFIGMYGVLDFAFALRHQPFFGWIQDLSLPDRLMTFSSPVSLLFFEVDALNLLPIIMTITWFLQSYMTPKPEDPQMQMQAKMMMYMPIFFGFICYNLASGLSFYFFVNSLLSMGEMRLIKKVLIPRMEESGSYNNGRKSWTQKLRPKKTR